MKKVFLLLLSLMVAGSVTLAEAAVVKKDPKAAVTMQKKQTTSTKSVKKQAVNQKGKKKPMAVANAPAKKPAKAKKR